MTLRHLGIRSVVDVGAGAQTESLRLAFPAVFHHLFEPDVNLCQQLATNYRDTPHAVYNIAIGGEAALLPDAAEGPILLKVDTDTDEVAVLTACTAIMPRVAVLMVEVTRQHISGIIRFAAEHDMILYDIVDLHYSGNQLHQVDMIFVADRMADRAFEPFQIANFYALSPDRQWMLDRSVYCDHLTRI